MPVMFKRSLAGYERDSIHREVERINAEYEKSLQELKSEITIQTHLHEVQLLQYHKLEQDLKARERKRQAVQQGLYEKHMEATQKNLAQIQKLEDLVTDFEEKMKSKHEQLARYRGELSKVKADLLRIRDAVEMILE